MDTSFPSEAAAPRREPSAAAPTTLPISFSGSGSEYFRIWSVNLLLTLVTLGVYFPWAKVRRLRYFYGSTRIGGAALDFHGRPAQMLRGYLLVVVLTVLYSVAGRISAGAGVVAGLIVTAIAPALVRAGLRFRLANTSWRGLRFHFDGTLGDAYKTFASLIVPAVAATLLGVGAATAEGAKPNWLGAGVPALLSLVLLPLFWWQLKRYQHDHYRYGQEATKLAVGAGPFYALFAKVIGIGLAAGVIGFGAVAVFGGAAAVLQLRGGARTPEQIAILVGTLFAGIVLVYVMVLLAVQPYATARLQNLIWNRTASANVQFVSTLRFRSLALLTFKNAALILVTLGFYVPFAKIAVTRLRLEAMSLRTAVDPGSFEGAGAAVNDAAGEAAGDLFGFDVGL